MPHDKKPRRPDYNVWACLDDDSKRGNVGVAWQNDDGTFSIQLNQFVVLECEQGMTIKLFPRDNREDKGKQERDSAATPSAAKKSHISDDDIPF